MLMAEIKEDEEIGSNIKEGTTTISHVDIEEDGNGEIGSQSTEALQESAESIEDIIVRISRRAV